MLNVVVPCTNPPRAVIIEKTRVLLPRQGTTNCRGRLCTIDLLVLTILDQLLLILQTTFAFNLNEANGIEPSSLSVCVPCPDPKLVISPISFFTVAEIVMTLFKLKFQQF